MLIYGDGQVAQNITVRYSEQIFFTSGLENEINIGYVPIPTNYGFLMTTINIDRTRLIASRTREGAQLDDSLERSAATLSKLRDTLHQALNAEPVALSLEGVDGDPVLHPVGDGIIGLPGDPDDPLMPPPDDGDGGSDMSGPDMGTTGGGRRLDGIVDGDTHAEHAADAGAEGPVLLAALVSCAVTLPRSSRRKSGLRYGLTARTGLKL